MDGWRELKWRAWRVSVKHHTGQPTLPEPNRNYLSLQVYAQASSLPNHKQRQRPYAYSSDR